MSSAVKASDKHAPMQMQMGDTHTASTSGAHYLCWPCRPAAQIAQDECKSRTSKHEDQAAWVCQRGKLQVIYAARQALIETLYDTTHRVFPQQARLHRFEKYVPSSWEEDSVLEDEDACHQIESAEEEVVMWLHHTQARRAQPSILIWCFSLMTMSACIWRALHELEHMALT